MQARFHGYMKKAQHHHWETVKEASRIPSAYQFYFSFDLYFLPEPLLQKIWRKTKTKTKNFYFLLVILCYIWKRRRRLRGCRAVIKKRENWSELDMVALSRETGMWVTTSAVNYQSPSQSLQLEQRWAAKHPVSSQCPHGGSQPSVTPVLGIQHPLLASRGTVYIASMKCIYFKQVKHPYTQNNN